MVYDIYIIQILPMLHKRLWDVFFIFLDEFMRWILRIQQAWHRHHLDHRTGLWKCKILSYHLVRLLFNIIWDLVYESPSCSLDHCFPSLNHLHFKSAIKWSWMGSDEYDELKCEERNETENIRRFNRIFFGLILIFNVII